MAADINQRYIGLIRVGRNSISGVLLQWVQCGYSKRSNGKSGIRSFDLGLFFFWYKEIIDLSII